MKIGIVCHPSHGGSGVVASELAKLLVQRGHELHIITHDLPFRLKNFVHPNFTFHQVQVNNYPLFQYPIYDHALIGKIVEVCKTNQIDILHAHYAVPHTLAALNVQQIIGGNLLVATTLHGTEVTVLAKDQHLQEIICYAVTKSNGVSVVSDSLKTQTHELMDNSDIDITRIYNFVDTKKYYPNKAPYLRAKYAYPYEKILVHISNYRPIKRTSDVIDIFNLVQKKLPARLLLVGDGPEISLIKNKINHYGIEDRVSFLGKIQDVSSILSIADLLLLPSEKESFGLVAIEAMACGTPTVGSYVDGIPEAVSHGETGFLCSIGDVEKMAEYAILLLSDLQMYQKFVFYGDRRVKALFSPDKIAEEYEGFYQKMMKTK